MRHILLILGLFFFGTSIAEAQRGISKRKYEKLIDLSGHDRLSGFHFAPGLTYTLTRFANKEEELYRTSTDVTTGTVDPKGRFGFYLEAGMYHVFKYPGIFHYLDWSIAWKNLRGSQEFTSTVRTESTNSILYQSSGNGGFSHHYLLGNVNLNSVKQIGHYTFLQNSLGLNGDYGIIQNQDAPVPFTTGYDPARFLLQLHYKFGVGFKVNKYWFIIPTLETPVLNIIQFEKGKSTIGVMNSRYRPLILTIRFARLRKPKSGDCPPVYGPEGDKQRQQNYQMSK
ncbi:MAG: hypothetical protein ACHQF2_03300 [Flavobacteriales bacterium]